MSPRRFRPCGRATLAGIRGSARRWSVLLAAVALSPALGARPASAALIADRAVAALRHDRIYVDPRAQYTLDRAEMRQLRSRIAGSHAGPMFVAILPTQAQQELGGDPGAVVRRIRRRLNLPGTYAVVVGASFRATSTDLPPGEGSRFAARAYAAHADQGVGPTLLDFVNRVGDAKTGRSPGGGGFPWSVLVTIAAVAAALAVLVGLERWRRRTQVLRPVRRAARDDLASLAAEIRAADHERAPPAAEEARAAALACYERAERALDRARSPEDVGPVTAAVGEGRYETARAAALLAGEEPPKRASPCFFDPRHGPAAREVEWSPDGEPPRAVPACEADAERVEAGAEPDARHVLVGGRPVPYWDAPPAFDAWRDGYFGRRSVLT